MERLEAARDVDGIVALDLATWVDGPGQPADRVAAHIREAVAEMDRGIWDPPASPDVRSDSSHRRPIVSGR